MRAMTITKSKVERWFLSFTRCDFMKIQIDIKSALVGLACGVVVTFLVAAAAPGGAVGRYQIAASQQNGMVLDTVTGQVWSYFFSSGGGRTDKSFYEPKLGQDK